MAKSKRQAGQVTKGKDRDTSIRFEARVKRSKKRRALQKQGRKASRRK
jgi:hypothetical protein